MARVLLEDALDAVAPSGRRRSVARKRKIVMAVHLVSGMLAALALKKPRLVTLQRALAALLMPSGNDGLDHVRRVLTKIHKLKGRLESELQEAEQQKLKNQLEALTELLIENDED
jgi:hypothetical protein